MELKNKNEIAILKLDQIIDFKNTIENTDYCDVELIVDAQQTIKTLVQELDYLFRKLEYKKYAY